MLSSHLDLSKRFPHHHYSWNTTHIYWPLLSKIQV